MGEEKQAAQDTAAPPPPLPSRPDPSISEKRGATEVDLRR